jgi:adenosine deaminase/adenosine deaminase CECR1
VLTLFLEDGETYEEDYWLHMLMFKYCHHSVIRVKYNACRRTTLGLGTEELTWHIGAAVYTAGTNRIRDNGVDTGIRRKIQYNLLCCDFN